MQKKQTKIVATVGPASESKEMLEALIDAGVNVFRLNFSHGEHEWHKEIIARIRSVSHEKRQAIAILADLQGPRIRTLVKAAIPLTKGSEVKVGDMATPDAPADVLFDHSGITAGVQVGHSILIEDGMLELIVTGKEEQYLVAQAKNDGTIKNHKGVILPDSTLKLDILSEKDRNDLRFVLEEGVDYVGLSFVGSAEDIETVRAEMKRVLGKEVPLPKIVAKIERKEAVKNLVSIVAATDAVMVARGDLGIEMPSSEVAILQKQIIRESLRAAKPVIVATQMLKSMTENPRPTRAEVSDVSNAVIDHTDAVMLSEETAMGKYPVETVTMMSEIIRKTEESPFDDLYYALHLNFRNEYSVMIRSVYELSKSFHAKAILILTVSGFTTRLLSHFRPEAHLLAATNNPHTYNELALVWGIDPYLFEEVRPSEKQLHLLMQRAKEDGKLSAGDQVAMFIGRTPESEAMQLAGIREVR